MKLESGRLSLLVGDERTTIEVKDGLSNTTFCIVKLTNEQLAQVLSRLCNVECSVKVRHLERVGKKHENFDFKFILPPEIQDYDRDHEKLRIIGQKKIDELNEGWIIDGYFGSQKSFFEREGVKYASAIARRYI